MPDKFQTEHAMIRVVIADDEARICQLIIALGAWDRLGVEVAGVAQNGVEALELVRSTAADMLITDIRMPGRSGLELIEQVRQISPNIKIIIISGYASFEYAQRALKNGVNDYLLKPINRQALNEAVERLADMIRAEQQSRAAMDASVARMETLHRERSALISDLLSMNPPRADRAGLEERYHFSCRSGAFQTLALKMDIPPSGDDGTILNAVREKALARLEEILEKGCVDAVCLPQDSCLYAVFCCEDEAMDPLRDALRELLRKMAAWNSLYGGVGFSIALGARCEDPAALPESLTGARLGVAERLIDGTGKLLEKAVSGQEPVTKRLSDDCFRQLNRAIDELDSAGVARTIARLRQSVEALRGIHGWEILELVAETGNTLIARLDLPDKRQIRDRFTRACDACQTVDALFDALSETAQRCMELMCDQKRDSVTRPVRQACEYIRQHYDEQISLEEVSAQVGLSPAYLSMLFKKEMNEGFAHYLMTVRIDQAREMLRETTMSVAEICGRVGYNDLKHFTHIFEKSVGVKPGVYRKLYG